MAYEIGSKMQLTYPNFSGSGIANEGMQEYAKRSGQFVTILSERPDAFQDGDGNDCRGFEIQAEDGWVGIVWPGELRDTPHPR